MTFSAIDPRRDISAHTHRNHSDSRSPVPSPASLPGSPGHPRERRQLSVTTYGAKGDGVTNDATAIQSAINAAASAGGTVTFPAGTFRIGSTIRPKSNVTLSGVAGQTILTMPAQATRQYMLYAENLSNLTLSGLSFRAGGYADNVSGLLLPGAQNCRASNLSFEGLVYGMKLGSGSTASGWVVSDIVVRNTEMPMYISYVHDSSFTRLDLEAVRLYTTTGDHAIYMERENRNLTFNDCNLSGGSGYCLQLWLEGGTSSGITFNNLSLDSRTGRYPHGDRPRLLRCRLQLKQLRRRSRQWGHPLLRRLGRHLRRLRRLRWQHNWPPWRARSQTWFCATAATPARTWVAGSPSRT